VNAGVQQVAKRFVEHAVTRQAAVSGKSGGDDLQAIMTTTAFGTGVAGVACGVVHHLHAKRFQNAESLLNEGCNVCTSVGDTGVAHAGSTFLNGLTFTAA